MKLCPYCGQAVDVSGQETLNGRVTCPNCHRRFDPLVELDVDGDVDVAEDETDPDPEAGPDEEAPQAGTARRSRRR